MLSTCTDALHEAVSASPNAASQLRLLLEKLRNNEALFIELAETIEARANHDRSLAQQTPREKVRDYHNGHADAHDSDARAVRAMIAILSPRSIPALRLVKEEEHV